MNWQVVIAPEVLELDLPRIPSADRERILRAVEHRLCAAPDSYGKPLGGRLAGLRRLRVGDYRVVYRLEHQRVVVEVVCVGVRRDAEVYAVVARRLRGSWGR